MTLDEEVEFSDKLSKEILAEIEADHQKNVREYEKLTWFQKILQAIK